MISPPPPGSLRRRSLLRAFGAAALRVLPVWGGGTAFLAGAPPARASAAELTAFDLSRDEDGVYISYAVEFHTGVLMPYFTVQSLMPGAPRNGQTYLSCRETASVILRRELRRRGLARDPKPEAVRALAERLHSMIAISRERYEDDLLAQALSDEADAQWNTPPVVL